VAFTTAVALVVPAFEAQTKPLLKLQRDLASAKFD
jgi:hypothetical protein